MKRIYIILTLATHLAAIPAFAQTTAATAATTGSGSGAGTYGSDRSDTLRPALFTDEGSTDGIDPAKAAFLPCVSHDLSARCQPQPKLADQIRLRSRAQCHLKRVEAILPIVLKRNYHLRVFQGDTAQGRLRLGRPLRSRNPAVPTSPSCAGFLRSAPCSLMPTPCFSVFLLSKASGACAEPACSP
jgi:hypothetical protein